ncbi:hypothetical protein CN157_29160 [Sinorhizobium meliloti]|nr:hypothetical protein CN157_29160 [Sinorhizobium meliloti]RVQ67513.1 hypothetical protein CN061_31265 [Sinorhizobium meliloti]
MNALWASENCDAFIVFRSFPSQENAPENSNQNWSSLKGSDHHRYAARSPRRCRRRARERLCYFPATLLAGTRPSTISSRLLSGIGAGSLPSICLSRIALSMFRISGFSASMRSSTAPGMSYVRQFRRFETSLPQLAYRSETIQLGIGLADYACEQQGGYRAMINVVENLSAAKQHTEKNWFRWTTHLTHPVLASIGKGPLFRHGTNDHTGSLRAAAPCQSKWRPCSRPTHFSIMGPNMAAPS